MVGDCYYYSKGVKQDYYEAFRWFKAAAEQGHAEAQYRLGICYDNGKGVKQDYKEAIRWYKAAAEQGHGQAQFFLEFLERIYGN